MADVQRLLNQENRVITEPRQKVSNWSTRGDPPYPHNAPMGRAGCGATTSSAPKVQYADKSAVVFVRRNYEPTTIAGYEREVGVFAALGTIQQPVNYHTPVYRTAVPLYGRRTKLNSSHLSRSAASVERSCQLCPFYHKYHSSGVMVTSLLSGVVVRWPYKRADGKPAVNLKGETGDKWSSTRFLAVRLDRFGLMESEPLLNSRSTAAEEGTGYQGNTEWISIVIRTNKPGIHVGGMRGKGDTEKDIFNSKNTPSVCHSDKEPHVEGDCMIACDACQTWYHRDCEGISSHPWRNLQDYDTTYTCKQLSVLVISRCTAVAVLLQSAQKN
ncbi:hypothetical protein GWK47_053624 [Chionoecetes opilio]|uniref:Uncharacterized protein n=1 Tax=Chionoecetes opilio TaxID=41210 RepID=A0A8J5C8Z9_CHIOP|nr:hypothetical protein GWK47_053624 [Chionoecetes opilio]